MYLAPQEIRTFHVTTATAGRLRVFQVTSQAELMEETLRDYAEKGIFALHAYVVMPDHLHLVITPSREVSLEQAMQRVKGGFSFQLKRGSIWNSGFNQNRIASAQEYAAVVKYVHENPVRAGIVGEAGKYPHSSQGKEWIAPTPRQFRG